MNIVPEIEAFHETLTSWRRHFHRFPETAFTETETSSFIRGKLTEFGIDVHAGIARTGLVGELRNGDGPCVGLRADIDAIFAQELNSFEHCSTVAGKMHGCGHDGHICMLLGAAKYLADTRDFNGTIYFIFQPAEENEGGAEAMINDGLFDRFAMDAVFGIHNWPGLPCGQFAVMPGPVMAGEDRFEITITGKGCHAAMPHLGVDPIPIASRTVAALQTVISRTIDPVEPAVLTITQIHGGDIWNVIPGEVVLRGTVRYFKKSVQQQVKDQIEQLSTGIAAAAGAGARLRYIYGYPPTINHEAESVIAEDAAVAVMGADNVHTKFTPSLGAEDFAYMLQQRPGSYGFIGSAFSDRDVVLHGQEYDFNDDVLSVGASYWVQLAQRYLRG